MMAVVSLFMAVYCFYFREKWMAGSWVITFLIHTTLFLCLHRKNKNQKGRNCKQIGEINGCRKTRQSR